MMRGIGVLGVIGCLLATPALSEVTPAASKLDNRVRVSKYVDGQVYNIRTSLTRATTVEFAPGERIVSIVAGDTASFKFESIPGERVFAIKPTSRGVRTNATVYTNQRSYYFSLSEGASPFYVLRFDYPQVHDPRRNAVTRAASSRRYGVNARNEITPVAIWDDGSFTYFRFPPQNPVPAIFKVTNGLERSVNSTMIEGRVMRVSGTSRQWAIRFGDVEVCVAEMVDG
jgi:type IV secretion system protein VirB9